MTDMTSEEFGFLSAIRENLADDTARLAYADWLDENGQEESAEYLRRSIELVQRCAVADVVLQTLLLAQHLPRLQELRKKLAVEWLAVVRSQRFDLLYMDEPARARVRAEETARAAREAEQKRQEDAREAERNAALERQQQAEERRLQLEAETRAVRGWDAREHELTANLESEKRKATKELAARDRAHAADLAELKKTHAAALEKASKAPPAEKVKLEEEIGGLKKEREKLRAEAKQLGEQCAENHAWFVGQWIAIGVLLVALVLTGIDCHGKNAELEKAKQQSKQR